MPTRSPDARPVEFGSSPTAVADADRDPLELKVMAVPAHSRGVSLPNAWLGNAKNIDLVQEFGNNRGFWKAFAD